MVCSRLRYWQFLLYANGQMSRAEQIQIYLCLLETHCKTSMSIYGKSFQAFLPSITENMSYE